MEMAKSLLGVATEKKVSLETLSNDIISSRIRDLSKDILQQVIEDIKASATKVSLQLDESTDVSLCSQLLVLARHVKKKKWWKSFYFVNHWKQPQKQRMYSTL